MKPTPAKPRIIMAHVEGSGTAATLSRRSKSMFGVGPVLVSKAVCAKNIGRALVLPSFAEGLPVVIMEAMALRRPVISTFVAGIPELVETGKCGWLVPAGDVPALVEAMRQSLQASPTELERLGK